MKRTLLWKRARRGSQFIVLHGTYELSDKVAIDYTTRHHVTRSIHININYILD